MDSQSLQGVVNPAKNIPVGSTIAQIISGGTGPLNLLNLVFFLIGLAFFANLIAAAFNYIFGEGSPDKIAKANTRILNSLVGLAIVFTAFVIVRVVLAVTGIEAPTDVSGGPGR